MKKFVLSVLKIVLLVFVILFLSKDFIISKLAFHPQKEHINFIREDYMVDKTITTDDGVKLNAILFTRKNHKKLLIFFHGNAGNLSHRLNQAQKIFDMGVDVLLVDYRGFGKSQGSISEAGLYKDAKSTLSWALKSYKEKNIFILGRSIGSVAAIHASKNKNLAGLILITPLSNAKDMAKNMKLGLLSFLADGRLDNLLNIKHIKTKTLFIHGNKDKLIPLELSKKLYKNLQAEKKLIIVDGAGHNDIEYVGEKYFKSIQKFISNMK